MRQLFRMIPRLRGEDAMRAAAIVAVGSGTAANAGELQGAWRRDAAAGGVYRPTTRTERVAAATAAGIRVVNG